MLPAAIRIPAIAAVVLAAPGDAVAHALAQRYDLPLPLGYYLAASGAAVAVSFVILALFMRRAGATRSRDFDERPLARGTLPWAIVASARILSVGVLALVIAAGLLGNQGPFKNIAPVTVWVIWWVGFSLLSAFVGNLWAFINPWAAVFEWAERFALRVCKCGLSLRVPYPARLGAWPACALFLLLAWFELVADGRDLPRNIAIAAVIYSAMTLAGCVAFGREAWITNAEVFAVTFGLFGRFAPLRFIRGKNWGWTLRPYAAGLITRTPLSPAMIAFTVLVLATVTVDGLMETPLWASLAEWLLHGIEADAKPASYKLLASALLVAGPLVLGTLYLGVCVLMKRTAGGTDTAQIAGLFVLSLTPIAIAYHLAHYFSLLMVAGQFIIPLVSDPFGYGWDLFGTTLYRIDIGIVDASFIWYLAVTAIVSGHIIAVWLAHVTAFNVFAGAAAARRSQYPMVALMIGYTMVSLWILAQPIVEFGASRSN